MTPGSGTPEFAQLADVIDVRALVRRAHDEGRTTVFTDGSEEVAAVVPLGVLEELADARIDRAVQRARERGAGQGPGIDHAEAMGSLGRDRRGHRATAA